MSNQNLFKLKETPTGRNLWAYMAAILEVTGMDKGGVFPLRKFFKNFSTHLEIGRIVKVDGGYKLTPLGMVYFNDRYSPANPQHIDRSQVEDYVNGIRSGGSSRWEPVL